MISIHGHEVLQMMDGNDYTESSLLNAINENLVPKLDFIPVLTPI